MSDVTSVTARRYLPQVIFATIVVAVLPVVVVWELRARGAVSSVWICVLLAIFLSLTASYLGTAYWARREPPADVMFSELLLWGWLRRLYLERKLSQATDVLGLDGNSERTGHDEVDLRERARMLTRLAAAVDGLDPYTVGHSRRVARLVCVLAHDVGLSDEQMSKVRAAAAVHDVGKLRVPRSVLNKPDKLTEDEFDLVKRHAEDGAAMVACLHDPQLTEIVRHHHERIDGTGYPGGLASEQIPIGARIVAVADTYDAITATRPYRPAAPHKRAINVLRAEAGKQLDAEVVRAFLSRYRGRRAVGLWATASVLPLLTFRRSRAQAAQPPPRSRDRRGAIVAASLALLATLPAQPGASASLSPSPGNRQASSAAGPSSGAGASAQGAKARGHHRHATAARRSGAGASTGGRGGRGSGPGASGGSFTTRSSAGATPGMGPSAAGTTYASAPVETPTDAQGPTNSSTCQAYNPQLCEELLAVRSSSGPSRGSATCGGGSMGGSTSSGSSNGSGVNSPNGSSSAGGSSGTSTAGGSGESGCASGGSGGTLPFTGLDIGVCLLLAGGLMIGGLVLRRQSNRI